MRPWSLPGTNRLRFALHGGQRLWGAIVPINPDKTVFDKKFEWLNIFDHTDPVAEALRAYQDAPCPPQNYSYKASPLLLLSHIQYLDFKENTPDCFVDRLTNWMFGNAGFQKPTPEDPNWDLDMRFAKGFKIRAVWWSMIAAVLALFLGWVWGVLLNGAGGMLWHAGIVLLIGALLVTGAGWYRFWFEGRHSKKLQP